MVISHAKQFVFAGPDTHITEALEQILVRKFSGEFCSAEPGEFLSMIPAGYTAFTTCQNPYFHAVAIWQKTCREPSEKYEFQQICPAAESFEAFAEWACLMQTQRHQLRPAEQQILEPQSTLVDQVSRGRMLRVENLLEDFNRLPFAMNHSLNFRLQQLLLQQQQTAMPHLSERAVKAVHNWFRQDFEALRYSPRIEPFTLRKAA